MSEKKRYNITYLLGAGASAKAIPIVNEFSQILIQMKDLLEICESDLRDRNQNDLIVGVQRLKKNLLLLLNEIDRFGTVDTYAKMLVLQGREEEIGELKITLGIIFTFFQECKDRRNMAGIPIHKNMVLQNKEMIDGRYAGLLANLLVKENGKIEIPSNINILSWNYDLQLEKSLQMFLGSKQLHDVFNLVGIYPEISEHKILKDPRIIHLNGIAGVVDSAGTKSTNSMLTRIKNSTNTNEVISNLAVFYSFFERMQIDPNLRMSFAWEDTEIAKTARQEAIAIMKRTNVLVVIGYSFPGFNLDVDRQLFEAFKTKGKEHTAIFYQDKSPNIELIRDSFGVAADKIIAHENVDQFLIPRQYL